MTAQVPDVIRVDNTTFHLCGVRGEGLFDPAHYGIEPAAPHSACWRGFVCGYAILDGRLVLDDLELWSEPARWRRNRRALDRLFGECLALDDEQPRFDAHGLAFPMLFTGGLLLGEDFIEELYVHMGFHPAYKYRNVLELTFESGRLLSQSDRSPEMQEIRLREGRGDGKRSQDVVAWINDCFRIDS
jgi:hypothetical protein